VSYDLVIRNGRLLTPAIDAVADLAVEGEKVAAIGTGLHGTRELDASGMYVLPGAIDGHVHMRTERKDFVYADTFTTGSIAAAFGGVTTMVDQAQIEPGLDLHTGVDKRLAEAEGQSLIDYSLHVNLREDSLERVAEIPSVAAGGFPSWKFFMYYPGWRVPDGIIFSAMQQVASFGGLSIVHAESEWIIDELLRQNAEVGRTSRIDSVHAHPAASEGEATHRALAMARVAGSRCLIFHMTCLEGIRELAAARARGQEVYGEVCPQYLLFGEEALEDPYKGPSFDVSPPLRTEEHREALWAALGDGTIDVVSTDHGPRRSQLDEHGNRFIPPPASGIETRLALMHTYGVRAGRLSLARWVDACCTRPAHVCRLPGKGDLVPGYDADIVLFDPERELTYSTEVLHSDIDHATYEGFTVRGLPVTTIGRGEVLVHEGELVAEPGRGRLAARA
jgi:dihydropyrimidinase